MLSIFAVDPKICQRLEWFRYCTEHCHPSQGRAIADLPPGQWCQKALEIINQLVQDLKLGPVRGKSLKTRLNKVRDRLVHRPGTIWDYMEPSWVGNAEQEHQREPFSAVISPDYPEGQNSDWQFHPDELDESQTTWATPSGISITRSSQAFTNAIVPMLRVASEIHFLDRHFSIDANSLYTQNYRQIIQDLASRCDRFPALTIHCCPDSNRMPDLAYFESELKRYYESLIPTGKSVTVVLWQTDEAVERGAHPFHNRYVLSNLCGVFVGYGTDSANVATDAPDTLQIVDPTIFKTLWEHSRKRTHPMISVYQEIEIYNA